MTTNQTMRYLSYFLFLLLFTDCKKEKSEFIKAKIIYSTIDSLNSEQSVEQFVRQFRVPVIKSFQKENEDSIHNFLKEFELKKINEFDRDSRFDIDSITKRISDSLNITESYYKKDIDNNGYTDLIVIGDNKGCGSFRVRDITSQRSCDYSVYCLMNYGNDSINPIDLIARPLDNSIVPKFTIKYNQPILEIHKPAEYHWIEKRKISKNEVIDLIYKFDTYIEYNKNPKKYQIEKIEFETENCFGECPYFKLTINNNKSAILNAISGNSIYENTKMYNSDSIPKTKGTFKTTLIEKDYNRLINLLNYMDFPNMNNRYLQRRQHMGYCILKITYGNGKTITIEDFGMFGTYGLKVVYEILFDLRFNQKWK